MKDDKKPGGAGPQAPPKNIKNTKAAIKEAKPKLKKANVTQGVAMPPEVQAQIIGALLSGQFGTDKEIADSVGVSKTTVARLKKQIPADYLLQAVANKKDLIGEKVMAFLENALDSLVRIDDITKDNEWLRKQDAAGIATFYGVKADKVIKILEAIERANSEPGLEDATEG